MVINKNNTGKTFQVQESNGIAKRHFLHLRYEEEKEKLCISGFKESVLVATEEIKE